MIQFCLWSLMLGAFFSVGWPLLVDEDAFD